MSNPQDASPAEYRNLSASDLEMADHYFETGNREGLRQLREKSSRAGSRGEPARWHHSNTKRN